MKKLLAFVLATLMLTAVFASCSCGGDGDPATTTDSTVDPVTNPTTDPATDPATEPSSDTETEPVNPIEIVAVADDKFTTVDETVYAYPRDIDNNYAYDPEKLGDIAYYSKASEKWPLSETERASIYAGRFVDGTELHRIGIYVANPEDPEQNGWSKIVIKDKDNKDVFVYVRNWVLAANMDYRNPTTTPETTAETAPETTSAS